MSRIQHNNFGKHLEELAHLGRLEGDTVGDVGRVGEHADCVFWFARKLLQAVADANVDVTFLEFALLPGSVQQVLLVLRRDRFSYRAKK